MNILITHYKKHWDNIKETSFPLDYVPPRVRLFNGNKTEKAIFIKTDERTFVDVADEKFNKIDKGWLGEVSFTIKDKVNLTVKLEREIPIEELNNYQRLQSGWYDELEESFFFSNAEKALYKVLKSSRILFTVNATMIFGEIKDKRLKPDFLICQSGKWGILEVMGDAHTSTNAPQDHNRARLFKDYGISCVEFYDANDCRDKAEDIVNDFLKRLSYS